MSPGNWDEATVGEVCVIKGGGTPSKKNEAFWGGDIPWVSPKDMKFDEIESATDLITQDALDQSTTNLIPKGSVLLVVRSGILARTIPIGLVQKPVAINQDVKAFIPKRGLDSRFLYYFFKAHEPALLRLVSKGATVHRLLAPLARDLPIPLPPLSEQLRIVSVLDAAFAGLATAEANTRQNLTNARELFDLERDRLFAEQEKVATICSIGDVCDGVEYGTSAKSSATGSTPVLRMGNIQDGEIDWSDLKYSDDASEIDRYRLSDGDVLFNRTNSAEHVGKTAIYRGDRDAIFAGYLIRLLYDRKQINGEYLNNFLNATKTREYGKTVMSRSVNQANINGKKLKGYAMPVPPLSEQELMAERLATVRDAVERLSQLTERKLDALAALKQSLLHRAFRGELSGGVQEASAALTESVAS